MGQQPVLLEHRELVANGRGTGPQIGVGRERARCDGLDGRLVGEHDLAQDQLLAGREHGIDCTSGVSRPLRGYAGARKRGTSAAPGARAGGGSMREINRAPIVDGPFCVRASVACDPTQSCGERRVVVELDGARWHDDPLTRADDADKQALRLET